MGLFDLFCSNSNSKFNVGDFVKIILTGDEGHIVNVFNDGTYEVELDSSGRIEYCKESELDKIW